MKDSYNFEFKASEAKMILNSFISYRKCSIYTDGDEIFMEHLTKKLKEGTVKITNAEHMLIMDSLDAYRDDPEMVDMRVAMNESIPVFQAKLDYAMTEQIIKPAYPGIWKRYLLNHAEIIDTIGKNDEINIIDSEELA